MIFDRHADKLVEYFVFSRLERVPDLFRIPTNSKNICVSNLCILRSVDQNTPIMSFEREDSANLSTHIEGKNDSVIDIGSRDLFDPDVDSHDWAQETLRSIQKAVGSAKTRSNVLLLKQHQDQFSVSPFSTGFKLSSDAIGLDVDVSLNKSANSIYPQTSGNSNSGNNSFSPDTRNWTFRQEVAASMLDLESLSLQANAQSSFDMTPTEAAFVALDRDSNGKISKSEFWETPTSSVVAQKSQGHKAISNTCIKSKNYKFHFINCILSNDIFTILFLFLLSQQINNEQLKKRVQTF